MTPRYLIQMYKLYHPDGHFFDSKTLRFFGERISEMRVLKKTVMINGHECWVLSSRQRKAPVSPQRSYHFFDICTYDHILAGV